MNTNDEKNLNDQLMNEANFQASVKLIRSLDEKVSRLRNSYKANQTQIKEAEVKSATAAEFEMLQKRDTDITRQIARLRARLEYDEQFQAAVKNGVCPILSQKCLNLKQGETLETILKSQFVNLKTEIATYERRQRDNSIALRISREAEKFLATLDTLRTREREIKEEGVRLKEERESLYEKIELLKSSNFSDNQTDKPETQIIIVKEEVICNVGSKCLRLAEFLFSSKTCKEVFYPNVGDWREDYIIALRKGRIFDALFISLKIYVDFTYTMILCSRFGKLLEFIMKIGDIIEFFSKFSK